MALNPLHLLKFKERLNIFREEHPRVHPFFHMLKEEGMVPGSILELKVSFPDGREHVMNIRLTENDVETIQMLSNLRKES